MLQKDAAPGVPSFEFLMSRKKSILVTGPTRQLSVLHSLTTEGV